MGKDIIVIGGGFGGLAAASRLLSRGHRVRLFEARDRLGGRAYTYEIEGFTFDGGPTIITAPFLFDEIFEAAGRRREDYVTFLPCDPFYRVFGDRGHVFNHSENLRDVLSEIDRINPADREGYLQLLESTEKIFNKGFLELADRPFLSVWDMIGVVPDLLRLRSHQSVYRYVSEFIEDDFLRRCFSFHPLLVGGNPFETTSVYAMIHYLEREWGVWYCKGGTGALVEALARLIREQGGEIRCESEVEEILIDSGTAKGVRLKDGSEHAADLVISNADAAHTYRRLVPGRWRSTWTDRKIGSARYSMSLFVIYFGTDRRYRESGLAHHNIILGKRYKGLLDDIFREKELPEDFSLYLHMPTLTDPSLAPGGHEAFYVLSPVPHLDGDTDWGRRAGPYRDAIMDFLERKFLPGLSDHIVAEHRIDPRHFRDTLNSYKGSAFSMAPLLSQSAWFRPHNRSEDIDGLYLVGAGTHPGAGLPGVLSSAKIAEELIANDR